MGFKKGRAARAAATCDGSTESSLNLHHDGTCVMYTAANGSEYRIDVATMQQLDIERGTCRAVYRKRGCGKLPHWEFEAVTEGARNYTPPKYVTFALEERWRALQVSHGETSAEALASAHWFRIIPKLEDEVLAELVELLELSETSDNDAVFAERDDELAKLAKVTAVDEAVQQALADRILGANWPIQRMLHALRCLMRLGLRPTPVHCRQAAIGRGSLTLLRMLLVEAKVDVCGLVLFEAGGAAPAKKSHAEGSWVQQAKESLKALMARGALLGHQAPRSKLLRKIEEDGNALWTERAFDGLIRAHPELPDSILERMRLYL